MQWQQSLSECGEDEGDCRWLQESALSACSSDHQRCDCGESEQHQVSWVYTSQRTISWTNNTAALAKKAQQRLYFLHKLRRARAPAPIMCTFYRGPIESILTSCITVWYGACNASCRKSLLRIMRAAEKIVGVSLLSLQDIYSTRLTRKTLCIAGDPTHPTHSFFSLLPSGRRLRSLQARTSRLKDSFIHQAVRKLNSLPSLPPPPLTPRTTELWHPPPTTMYLRKTFIS